MWKKNPGPQLEGVPTSTELSNAALVVTSYNVCGLNDENKLWHLINHLYKKNPGKSCDFVACTGNLSRAGRENSLPMERQLPLHGWTR